MDEWLQKKEAQPLEAQPAPVAEETASPEVAQPSEAQPAEAVSNQELEAQPLAQPKPAEAVSNQELEAQPPAQPKQDPRDSDKETRPPTRFLCLCALRVLRVLLCFSLGRSGCMRVFLWLFRALHIPNHRNLPSRIKGKVSPPSATRVLPSDPASTNFGDLTEGQAKFFQVVNGAYDRYIAAVGGREVAKERLARDNAAYTQALQVYNAAKMKLRYHTDRRERAGVLACEAEAAFLKAQGEARRQLDAWGAMGGVVRKVEGGGGVHGYEAVARVDRGGVEEEEV